MTNEKYEKIQKFMLKLGPVGLDLSVARGTTMVVMQIFEISCKIMSI